MMLVDLYQETMASIKANKTRSSLTILGIVIGIGSVIAMVSVGQGAQKSIESSIQSIGSNLLMVMPGSSRSGGISSGRGSAQSLTLEDVDAIKEQASLIKAVAPDITSRYQLSVKGENTNTSVVGTVSSYATVRSLTVDKGVFLTEGDYRNANKVAVLGPTTAEDLFGEGVNPIGKKFTINKIEFRVVGLTKSKGSSGQSNQDDIVYIPLSAMQRYLSGASKYVNTISLQAANADQLTAAQNQVTTLLLRRHKITDSTKADFQIMNQADIVSTASSVTGTFTMLLAAIAGISLLVGGIGIMNMMLTTVTERTREIGLRKAIGAKKAEVSQQFLLEAVELTFIGGALGVGLGWLSAFLITKFANVTTSVSWSSVALAFGVSALIGIVFGYYPASRAAKLNTIEALRYE